MKGSKSCLLLLAALAFPMAAQAQEPAVSSEPKDVARVQAVDALTAARFSITIDGHEIASFSELQDINARATPPDDRAQAREEQLEGDVVMARGGAHRSDERRAEERIPGHVRL